MTQAMTFVPTLPPEEAARANFYGLLARLFYAPPDAALLQALAQADPLPVEEGELAAAWHALVQAARQADLEAVRDEFETAFIGTGKAPVTLYTTAYALRFTNETPLAELRGVLASLGLARRDEAAEPEDHIAALCDTMRHLVAEQKRSLAEQSRFFARWIGPTYESLCDAIERSPQTEFYRHVGRFARSFLGLEHAAFEML